MLIAFTREVSPAMNRCELTFLDRQEIDLERAGAQHCRYRDCLSDLGAQVITLPAEPDLPDSVFVEDPAVVVDEIAVMAHMGAASRRLESESLGAALARFRPLHWMQPPATLEGGDVIRAGRTLFVGASLRTNAEGIVQLGDALAPYGYDVRAVPIRDCLHLKSGACYLGRGVMLANRAWVDAAPFDGYRILDVAEEWAADVLPIGGVVLMPAGFPKTQALLEREGFPVNAVDVSELQKAEAGVTCMSILFESATASSPRPSSPS
jgi:dimethylargininase